VSTVVAATLLPFFPGGYDALAHPLAKMAWMLGRTGLLFVPAGALWLLSPRPSLVAVTVGAGACVGLVLVLVACAAGPLLAGITGLLAGFVILRLRRATPVGRTGAALLILVPVAVLTLQGTLLEPVARQARNRVIASSAPLIMEIESYRARHGVYPASIFALYGDVKPGTMGVERYSYEPSGAAYNVIFELPTPVFGLRQFVVFNPLGQQRLTVHETDRLRLDDAGRDADNAGYTIVESLPQPHWKLFTFRS